MTILVGTASWADKSLVDSGKFYPPEVTSPEERLRYYASQFPIVEVDSSYYAMPLPATTRQWAERTPDNFVFNIKAFRLFTGHQAQPRVLPKDLQEALGRPLHENIYYRDLPEEIQKELWARFSEPSSRCTRPASSARCISSSRPGSRQAGSRASWSSTALASWKARRWRSSSGTPLGGTSATASQRWPSSASMAW